MVSRIVLTFVALLLALNGINMLFDPPGWYASIQSVAHTGPLNPHFVRDIGCAYLTAAFGVELAAARPVHFWPGILSALAFLGLHALVHIWETIEGMPAAQHMGTVDMLGVYGPPFILALIIAWARFQPALKEA